MRPSGRLLALLGAWTVVGLVAAFVPVVARGFWAMAALLGVALLLECAGLFWTPAPKLTRRLAPALAVGQWHPVTLRLESQAPVRQRLLLFDGYPATHALVEGLPAAVSLPARGWAELSYRVKPTERGEAKWGPVELRVPGPLGLLTRRRRAGAPALARVYPDFRAVAKFTLLSLEQRVAQMGIHVKPQRGEGLEFFQMREYREGDSQRQVDWKASSRRSELISREYRQEQNQQVMLLLDCGRRMHAKDGELSHFDHVLNAALLLSHVALREGDAVGLCTFSGPRRFLTPKKGAGAMGPLINGVFDLRTSQAPSDYAEAVQAVATHQRRRALVVLLTNLRDDDCRDLARLLLPLRRRHLVLVASLREAALDAVAAEPVHDFEGALRVSSMQTYLSQREKAHADIRRSGVLTLDVPPQGLPVALVNQYLDIKRTGLL